MDLKGLHISRTFRRDEIVECCSLKKLEMTAGEIL